ncbi:hypothetical protein [Streptomyces sp. H72]
MLEIRVITSLADADRVTLPRPPPASRTFGDDTAAEAAAVFLLDTTATTSWIAGRLRTHHLVSARSLWGCTAAVAPRATHTQTAIDSEKGRESMN